MPFVYEIPQFDSPFRQLKVSIPSGSSPIPIYAGEGPFQWDTILYKYSVPSYSGGVSATLISEYSDDGITWTPTGFSATINALQADFIYAPVFQEYHPHFRFSLNSYSGSGSFSVSISSEMHAFVWPQTP